VSTTTHVPGLPQGFAQEALPLPLGMDDGAKGVESPIPEGYVHDATICQPCATRRPDGSWLDVNLSHCRTCHRSWSRNGRTAHCATCHEHFTTPGNFDTHLAPVNAVPCCRDPRTLTTKAGEPKLRQRDDGMWTGAGEYDREAQ